MNTPRQPWEEDPSKWKEKESNSFSTMPLKNVSRLTERNRASVLDLLTVNDVELPQLIAEGRVKPYALVTFSRVEWEVEGDKVVPKKETLLAKSNLYDLAPYGKTHCLGIGRYEENIFKPYIHDKHPDGLVSREHGLVMLLRDNKGKPCVHYHDIGTQHKGSTNGTYVNDIFPLHNVVHPWPHNDYMSMGNYRVFENKDVRSFRVRYKLSGESDVQRSG